MKEDLFSPDRSRRIVTASWFGVAGNGLLAILKTVIGIISGSVAVVSDGVDSGLDVLTSGITLVAARITAKPPDIDHPYGHSRVEAIATRLVSFIILFAGFQLAMTTFRHLIEGVEDTLPSTAAIWVTIVSILGKTGLALHKYVVGKRDRSPMLVADAANMRADIVISLGVLIGLGGTYLLSLPIIDSIVAFVISIWIIFVALRILLETNTELMEGHKDRDTYQKIFNAIETVPGAEHPHRTRVRTIGTMQVVDLDIEVDGDLTVTEAHAIAQQTEEAIKAAIENVYDVLVHVEPFGNVEKKERYGLSRRKLGDSG